MISSLFVRCTKTQSPRPTVNFFIPYNLGRIAQLPGYSLDTNWQAESRLLDHLLQAAPQVEFSYTTHVKGEEHLLHSRLQHIEVIQEEGGESPVIERLPLEKYQDFQAPAVTDKGAALSCPVDQRTGSLPL